MKSELQLLEECIEAKTKEYQLALLKTNASDTPWSSFTNVSDCISQKYAIDRLQSELLQLQARREELLGDIIEQELILGNREELIKYLLSLSDGTYKLIKIERKNSASQ